MLKLAHAPSGRLRAHYALLWSTVLAGLLHLFASLLGDKLTYDAHFAVHLIALELYTTLELSAVAFLLHTESSSGVKDLFLPALIAAPSIATIELVVLAFAYGAEDINVFGFGCNTDEGLLNDSTIRWGYWAVRSSAFSFLYLPLAVLPVRRWQVLLPVRTFFAHYFHVMFGVHAATAVAAVLLLFHFTSGFCIFAMISAAYFSLQPSIFYAALMHDAYRDTAADVRRPLLDAVEEAEEGRASSTSGQGNMLANRSFSTLTVDTGYQSERESEEVLDAPFADKDEIEEDLSPLPVPKQEERGIG
jgi:hypothetical protein